MKNFNKSFKYCLDNSINIDIDDILNIPIQNQQDY